MTSALRALGQPLDDATSAYLQLCDALDKYDDAYHMRLARSIDHISHGKTVSNFQGIQYTPRSTGRGVAFFEMLESTGELAHLACAIMNDRDEIGKPTLYQSIDVKVPHLESHLNSQSHHISRLETQLESQSHRIMHLETTIDSYSHQITQLKKQLADQASQLEKIMKHLPIQYEPASPSAKALASQLAYLTHLRSIRGHGGITDSPNLGDQGTPNANLLIDLCIQNNQQAQLGPALAYCVSPKGPAYIAWIAWRDAGYPA